MIARISAFILGAVVIAGIILGVLWGIWSAWCWAVPQIWPTGPAKLIEPGYWLFVVVWLLAGWLGRVIFGRGGKSE